MTVQREDAGRRRKELEMLNYMQQGPAPAFSTNVE